MAVKRSFSAARMLAVFELVARDQPIGVSALARALGADRSAVQRDLMTLADAGWIGAVAKGQWELTPHLLSLARPPHSSLALRQRFRPALERLHAQTHETIYLAVPDQTHFVVIDALESRHALRVVPALGMVVPLAGSASGKAFLPYLPPAAQAQWLGAPPDAAMEEEFARTRATGYAVNDGDVMPGSVAIAAPVFESGERPLGVIVLAGPAERIGAARWRGIGESLREAGLVGAF